MKKFVFILLVISSMAANAQIKDGEQKVVFTTNITCHHCKEVIMKSIPFEKGVRDVVVDVPTKEVTVLFKKDKITVDQLIKAFDKIGYIAVEKKPDEGKKE